MAGRCGPRTATSQASEQQKTPSRSALALSCSCPPFRRRGLVEAHSLDDVAEDDVAEQFVHATAIAVGDACALIRGGSGAGKSDLALRCLTLGSSSVLPEPVHLVSDDQVLIKRH